MFWNVSAERVDVVKINLDFGFSQLRSDVRREQQQ
jgi:hypothetical protein